jgi:hypothetical protein
MSTAYKIVTQQIYDDEGIEQHLASNDYLVLKYFVEPMEFGACVNYNDLFTYKVVAVSFSSSDEGRELYSVLCKKEADVAVSFLPLPLPICRDDKYLMIDINHEYFAQHKYTTLRPKDSSLSSVSDLLVSAIGVGESSGQQPVTGFVAKYDIPSIMLRRIDLRDDRLYAEFSKTEKQYTTHALGIFHMNEFFRASLRSVKVLRMRRKLTVAFL